MRCWDCDKIVVTPDIVNGEVGVAGIIRAGGVDRSLTPQTVTVEFKCSCGTMYVQTTSKRPGKGEVWKDQSQQ